MIKPPVFVGGIVVEESGVHIVHWFIDNGIKWNTYF